MNTTFMMSGLLLLIVSCILMSVMVPGVRPSEAFMNYAATAAAVDAEPVGAFDGIKIKVSEESYWRKSPDVKPVPAFEPGPDNLFFFKNNECKPECCPASYSCGGGCVCMTMAQRKYLNERGGNNTRPGDTV